MLVASAYVVRSYKAEAEILPFYLWAQVVPRVALERDRALAASVLSDR